MNKELLLNLFAIIAIGFPIVVKIIWPEITSVSQSFYKLKEKCGKCRLLFTIYCWSIMVMAMFISENIIIVFAGIGLFYVGGAPNYKDDVTNSVHYVGAVIAIIGIYAYVLFSCGYYGLTSIGVIASGIVFFYYWNIKRRMSGVFLNDYHDPTFYWVESIAIWIITASFYINFYCSNF